MTSVFSYFRALCLAAAALLAVASAAHAGGDEHGYEREHKRERGHEREHEHSRLPTNVLPAYVQECSGCHIAYPPGMLPRISWQRIMSGLEQHYGSDASIDAATARQIDAWLQAHTCSVGGRSTDCAWQRHSRTLEAAPPEDRITRSAWFERKHRKIVPAVWQLPDVKSAANCAACHTGAEQGDYDDDSLRMPAGLTWQQRSAWRD